MNQKLIDSVTRINKENPKWNAKRVADSATRGWSFSGQSISDHQKDVQSIIDLLQLLRK